MRVVFLPSWKPCKSRAYILAIVFVLLVMIYVLINVPDYNKYTGNHPWLNTGICRNRTARETAHLLNLTYKVHRVLDEMGIEHWLSSGSVFGALRYNSPQPWDDDVDIGMDGDGVLSQMDLSEFIEAFQSAGLRVIDGWSNSRSFKILGNDLEFQEFKVDLMAFYRYGKWMKRTGWGPWLLFINFNRYHTFPARLIQPPLPKIRFGVLDMPVPREGIEIQKYVFPNDWWKVVKPAGCE